MNRQERRHLSATPQPGSRPVEVSRAVPMTMIAGADGRREVVNTDTDEPCYSCKCCVLWTETVETLRAAMLEHEQGEHTGNTVHLAQEEAWVRPEPLPGCLVCQLLAGAADD